MNTSLVSQFELSGIQLDICLPDLYAGSTSLAGHSDDIALRLREYEAILLEDTSCMPGLVCRFNIMSITMREVPYYYNNITPDSNLLSKYIVIIVVGYTVIKKPS
jgi:hypothetical protein